MRKIISLGLLALIFSLISSQALAGKVPYCEDNKQALIEYGLYGLCNAYYNADNETARAQIEFNYNQKAVPGAPPIREEATDCPCWDLDVLKNIIACSGYDQIYSETDVTGDESGSDYVEFYNTSISIQVEAGFTLLFPDLPTDLTECFVNTPAGVGKPQLAKTSDLEDGVCRLEVLGLIADPPTDGDCVTE